MGSGIVARGAVGKVVGLGWGLLLGVGGRWAPGAGCLLVVCVVVLCFVWL